ncbi:unnamed protein product [Blepharisma stoltei]|uniref:Uncharacterized protein n=1 Tax=Blepharisma stoltei TaxID=1481888 RepID=A0AAU9JLF1_9CILI|nr:unnamed protein product [Blepharisma stoltei]
MKKLLIQHGDNETIGNLVQSEKQPWKTIYDCKIYKGDDLCWIEQKNQEGRSRRKDSSDEAVQNKPLIRIAVLIIANHLWIGDVRERKRLKFQFCNLYGENGIRLIHIFTYFYLLISVNLYCKSNKFALLLYLKNLFIICS